MLETAIRTAAFPSTLNKLNTANPHKNCVIIKKIKPAKFIGLRYIFYIKSIIVLALLYSWVW